MSKPVILQPGLCLVRAQYDPNPDTGDQAENVLWFKSSSTTPPTLANLIGMAAAFDHAWGPMWQVAAPSSKHFTGSTWTDYSSTTGLSYSSVGTLTPYAGSLSSAVLPPNTAGLISLSNGERYRGGHFRIYLPWMGMAAVSTSDSNMMTSAVNASLASGFAAINAATTGSGQLGGQTQMLYRSRTDPVHAQLFPIHSFTVQLKWATQRRRMRKAPHH